jgi:hypothetical protein
MAAAERVITLGQLVQDDPPTLEVGGLRFDGTQTTWPRGARFESADEYRKFLLLAELLRERCETPDAVTEEWLDEHLTIGVVSDLVAVLYRGEDPRFSVADAPARPKRKRA